MAVEGAGPVGSPGAVAAWEKALRILEQAAAREAVARAEAERAREDRDQRGRREQEGLEGAEAAAQANPQVQNVAEALAAANIGPGLGFFPSLFALQFTAALTPPLERPGLMETVSGAEVAKLRRVDRFIKGLTALLFIYVLFFV